MHWAQGQTVKDIDGNSYRTVTIGIQTWMAENLKTTTLNDGTSIPLITNGAEWRALNTSGFCWYNFDTTAKNGNYGALYNWYTVNTGKLCPTGSLVPTDAEWTVLTDFLRGDTAAVGKLKESGFAHWLEPNTGATNETDFTALPGGYCDVNGEFGGIGFGGRWWSSSYGIGKRVYGLGMNSNDDDLGRYIIRIWKT